MMDDKQFKENFRVERSTFLSLVNQIGPFLEKLNTNYRTSISVKQRIACALYTLGSSSELRTISHLFGIGRSTAREILHEFCSVIVHLFFKRFIKFPATPQEIQTTINGFQDKCNYPVCIGALDGTHIPIKLTLGVQTNHFNFKKYYSVIMLATVNSDLLFTYVNIGAPGRCNDASIFNRCILSEVIEDPIYANHFITMNNTKIQAHLIADSAFALNITVLKPFADRADLPKCHSTFNYRLSRARCSVERAFGSLKKQILFIAQNVEGGVSRATTIMISFLLKNSSGGLDAALAQVIRKSQVKHQIYSQSSRTRKERYPYSRCESSNRDHDFVPAKERSKWPRRSNEWFPS